MGEDLVLILEVQSTQNMCVMSHDITLFCVVHYSGPGEATLYVDMRIGARILQAIGSIHGIPCKRPSCVAHSNAIALLALTLAQALLL